MEAIIYNNEAQAIALQNRVHSRLAGLGKSKGYKATKYADLIHHPTDGRVACPIEARTNLAWYDDLVAELTPGEINNIETLTSDWFPVTDEV